MELKQKQSEALDLMKSGKNVFLTGKAGTGKSFVTDIFTEWAESEKKKILICAPTGIAALNIGGSTIHRAFKLPIDYVKSSGHLFSSRESMEILEKADIVLIDEVSMLRADTFSHVEYKLRDSMFENNNAFGGKQIIVVGDFYQLPPVVKREEKTDLFNDYGGQYAFESKAWKSAKFDMVELDEVVRQSDLDFVDALNSIREKNVYSDSALGYVNNHAVAENKDDVVTLCFTNKAAEQINKAELNKIDEPPMQFIGNTFGQVRESDKPVPEILDLKLGAKIIFCVNDQNGRFVNGTTGHITGFEDDFIIVDDHIELDRYTWEIKEPTLNKESGKIEYDVIGSYKQYPIKLAWAITIHKSQGQTITGRVHLQMDGSFRPHGSLYVALSRCTAIENLSLDRPLGSYDLQVDESVRTALLSMSQGVTAIEIPSYALPFFNKMLDIIELNPTERQLTGMFKRLNDWEDKLKCSN